MLHSLGQDETKCFNRDDSLLHDLTYKAKREGVPSKVVKSENTSSSQCPKCQHIDKKNRKTRNL
jgi:transposase